MGDMFWHKNTIHYHQSAISLHKSLFKYLHIPTPTNGSYRIPNHNHPNYLSHNVHNFPAHGGVWNRWEELWSTSHVFLKRFPITSQFPRCPGTIQTARPIKAWRRWKELHMWHTSQVYHKTSYMGRWTTTIISMIEMPHTYACLLKACLSYVESLIWLVSYSLN